jgi:beta-lactamase class A
VRRIVLAAAAAHTARQVSVVVYDLRRGQLFSVHPNRIFRSASIIKLAVMVAAFQARADGSLRADRFERLRPYLRRMITISDNPSTTYLLGVLGRTRVNEAMAALGFQSIHLPPQPQRGGSLAGSKATPAEVAQLLAKLAHREVVSPAASNEMLLLLGASARRKRIPAGLPARPELWVGNKTGTLNGLAHDCALVLDRSSGIGYTLAIFTEGLRSETAGDQLCRTVSRAVFEAMLEAAPARSAATRPAAAP